MKELIFKSLYRLYNKNVAFRKNLILKIIRKLEKGFWNKRWQNKIYEDYHGIKIGIGSYGGCYDYEIVNSGTSFGNFCSIAHNVCVFNRNHPSEYISTHPMFFNSNLGFVEKDTVSYSEKKIGHDVWIGQNAIILPSVKEVGHGAIIGAGAVVTKDVKAYAIVGGVPAKEIGFRFPQNEIEELLKLQWWYWDLDKIRKNLDLFWHISSIDHLKSL